jgi:hypothetical protein
LKSFFLNYFLIDCTFYDRRKKKPENNLEEYEKKTPSETKGCPVHGSKSNYQNPEISAL